MSDPTLEANRDRAVEAYERLARRTLEQLERGKDQAADLIDRAIDVSSEQLVAAEELSREEAQRASAFLRRDLTVSREDLERLRETAQERLDPRRVGSGLLSLSTYLLDTVGDQFKGWAERSRTALEFRTGEVTGPGTLACRECGSELRMTRAARIPPCPSCKGTDFHKSY